jgi:hypothetical protein
MKKRTPTVYLIAILFLILYGFIGNALVFTTQSVTLLSTLNNLNRTITVFWFFFNVLMIFFFIGYAYETKALIFACYYVAIGAFNISLIFLHYISNYSYLFWFSVATKIIELIIVIFLLRRNLRGRTYLGKL